MAKRKKRHLKPAVRRKISQTLKLRAAVKSKRGKEVIGKFREEIFKDIREREFKAIQRTADKRGIALIDAERLVKRSIRPFFRVRQTEKKERETFYTKLKSGKNKGLFRHSKTKRLLTASNLNRSLAMVQYWAQIKFLSELLNISKSEARKSYESAEHFFKYPE